MSSLISILILEDDPERHRAFKALYFNDNLVIVETASACIHELKTKKWDYLLLDHDLGGEVYVPSGEGTGYEVAKFLEENPEYKPRKRIFLHSLNTVGRQNMQAALPEAVQAPGCWLDN